MPIIVLLLAILLFPEASSASLRVVGGETSRQVGASVALVEKNANSYRGYFCAGTLIKPRWVLTSRECVYAYSVKDMDAVIGRKNLKSFKGERIAPVKAYFIPFERSNYKDVALLYLAKSSSQQTASISEVIPGVGSEVQVRGWGAKKLRYPAKLQQAGIRVLNPEKCEQAYQWAFSGADMFCAAKKNIDACFGDAGGPLFFEGSLVGVVSFGGGDNCAEEEFPGTYAKIPRKWINWRVSNPPQRYKNIKAGSDTKKEPKPFVLFTNTLEGDTSTDRYTLYISAQSNFQVVRARARVRGEKDSFFCQELGCIGPGEWFSLNINSGQRDASAFFKETNEFCPVVDVFIEIKHKKRRFWRDTSDLCF